MMTISGSTVNWATGRLLSRRRIDGGALSPERPRRRKRDAVALAQLDERITVLAVEDDSFLRLFLLALSLRLAGIENWTGRAGDERCPSQTIEEPLEPRLESRAFVNRAGVDRHEELAQV